MPSGSKGIFITTASYSKKTEEFVNADPSRPSACECGKTRREDSCPESPEWSPLCWIDSPAHRNKSTLSQPQIGIQALVEPLPIERMWTILLESPHRFRDEQPPSSCPSACTFAAGPLCLHHFPWYSTKRKKKMTYYSTWQNQFGLWCMEMTSRFCRSTWGKMRWSLFMGSEL